VTDFVVARAEASHVTGLLELFERAACPCYCRYFHFSGDKNAWLDRSANAPEKNRAEMRAALESASEEMSGVVAVLKRESGACGSTERAQTVIGWMKIAHTSALEKLYAQRLYKGLNCFAGDRSQVFSVACFLIDAAWRRRGVASALLAGGIELAKKRGAHAIEAFPRRAEGVADEQLWTGPCDIFVAAGFVEISDFAPYPVLRLTLR
jgi:GNAT superfamily N-acetyltransferase